MLSPLVFSSATIEAFEYTKVTLLLTAAILAAALAPGALARDRAAAIRDPLGTAVVLFVLSAIVSTVVSIGRWASLLGTHESYFGLTTILAYAVLFLATRAVCESAADLRRLRLAPIVAAAPVSLYAIVQIAGLDPIVYARVSGLGGFVRPFATLGHPNFLSAFLVMTAPLVVHALVRALGRGQRVVAAALGAIAVVSMAAVAIAVSRGAWLALAAAALVMVIGAMVVGERPAVAAIGVLAGGGACVIVALALVLRGGVGGMVLAGLGQRLRQLGDAGSRQHIWRAAWEIFRDHPLVGSGLDTFQLAFAGKRTAAYWNIEWNGSPTRAHNEALNLLATQGLLGALGALALLVGVALVARRALRSTDDRLLVLALIAGGAAFVVQDLFSFTVAGCGTLVVTQAALLSRLASPGVTSEARDGSAGFATILAVGVLLAVGIFATNLSAGPLLDEPGRVGGGLAVLAALLGGAGTALALVRADRASGLAAAGDRAAPRSPRAVVARPPRWRATAVVSLVAGAILLILLVVRPLVAAWAAQDGVLLTATSPGAAVESLERAVRLDPFVELYWVKLGAAAHAQARRERDREGRVRALGQARTAYERARALAPANAYDEANVARVIADLAVEGAAPPAEAFAGFDRALARDPNNAYFYVDAAGAAVNLGDAERARDYAARGVARYPRFGIPRAQVGYAALMQRRVGDALEPLREAIAADWHGATEAQGIAASNLAAAYLHLHRPAEAEPAARLALRLAPALHDARYNLARALEGLGRRDEAVAEYRNVLAQRPDYAPAREALRALSGS
jgi:O-antigen ligase